MPVPPLTPLATAVLRVGEPERILEIQCGEGEGVLFLAREFPRARVRGLDPDQRAVRRATSRVGLDPEGRVAFKAGSPRRLPFPDSNFDLVVLVDAVPHPPEVTRVLRPGGCLLVVRTESPHPPRGLRARFRARRLAAGGIEPTESAQAGEGSFSIGRLSGSGAANASV